MRLAASLLVVVLFSAGGSQAEEPKKLGLKESIQVGLVPLEVTVWPKKEGSDACRGLTIDDFELRVDRKPQKIYAVDSLAVSEEIYMPEDAAKDESASRGLSFVLLFDLWHLDVFHQDFSACPSTKPLALEEARKFVREEFTDGDRLLLVTSAGWPVIHEGWLRTKDAALAAIDRLAVDRQVVMMSREHMHHNGWIAGMKSLFAALGRYPGRKDVIYLADDFRFDDIAMRMFDIAARAQSAA